MTTEPTTEEPSVEEQLRGMARALVQAAGTGAVFVIGIEGALLVSDNLDQESWNEIVDAAAKEAGYPGHEGLEARMAVDIGIPGMLASIDPNGEPVLVPFPDNILNVRTADEFDTSPFGQAEEVSPQAEQPGEQAA